MRRPHRSVIWTFFAFAVSCGGGNCGAGGCGGCGDAGYVFPEDDPNRPDAVVQDEISRVRITQDFLDFIQPLLPELIRSQIGGVGGGLYVDAQDILHIPIPDVTAFNIGIASASLEDSEALLWLDDIATTIAVDFETPNQVRIRVDDIRLGLDARIKENVAGTTSSCPIIGDLGPNTAGEPPHAASISFDIVIDPGVGPRPERLLDLDVTVDSIVLEDLAIDVPGSAVYCQEPECMDCLVEIGGNCLDPGGRCAECNVFCGAVTNAGANLISSLINVVRPLLNSVLAPVLQGVIDGALADFNNLPAKLETQVDLAALSGLEALRNGNPLGVLIAPEPGRFPVIDRGNGNGMEITVAGGAEAELAPCIPPLDDFMPNPGPVPEPPATDDRGRPYHVFTAFSSSYLNQFLYTLHRSGTLCLKLSSEDVTALTGGAFSLNASLLGLLAADLVKVAEDAAPVIVELKPRNAATLELGNGLVIGQDMMGNDIYDWLFKVNIEDLGIAFHVLIHDRYVRVFEVTTDIFVGANITVLPDNSLQIALGELRIDDFDEVFNELLTNAKFEELLPTLIDLALGAVLSQSLTFDVDVSDALSNALGGAPLFMRINEIVRDGIQEDFLRMTLTFTSSATSNLSFAAETVASLMDVDGTTGALRMYVPESGDPLEYQVRIDGGLWRAPVRPKNGVIGVIDPKLRILGEHNVEVRARVVDDYRSLDPTPAEVRVVVEAPGEEVPESVAVVTPDVENDEPGGCVCVDSPMSATPWSVLLAAVLIGRRRRR